ncbi:hypothetical protein KAM354_30120 [Aeromonas caviae]|nr:hypothetical protein KAM354_30120 [Aeromonas caviae]
MARKTYVEVTCDGCGCAEHFLHPLTNEQIADSGYIVEGRRHFCSASCKDTLAQEADKAEAPTG